MLKKLLLVSAFATGLTSVAFAGGLPEELPQAPCAVSDSGFYLGVEGGWGITNWKNIEGLGDPIDNWEVSKDNGFVGRAFLGYDINKYFAVEGGYSYFFFKPQLDINSVDIFEINRTQAIDLVGKIKAPVCDNFDLYAKLGVNYYMSNLEGQQPDISSNDLHSFNVIYGAGADYTITPNVIANVEWLRYNGNPDLSISEDPGKLFSKYQPYADAFMIGLRYRFDF
ncbi:MAG: outer membrane beta-barrel protein [Gammaproteobacteria bacterium]|nr:outer membrane beta-barrel protein [Gammaproteobacteria bacterium]